MSFTLEVTIGGLCVLVPDRAANQMHVLMPRTRGGGHACGNLHEARIYFDPKYVPGNNTAQDAPVAQWQWNDIYGGSATVTGVGSVPPVIPPQVLVIRASVHPECLPPDGGERLDARITLQNCAPLGVARGSIWGVPNQGDQELTFEATWSMTVDAESLQWNMTPLGAGTAPQTTELVPVGGVVCVKIVHGIQEELPEFLNGEPPAPAIGSPPEHLNLCLESVFPGTSIPDVRYQGPVIALSDPELGVTGVDKFGTASTFSCMLTTGEMP